jgi:ABC-type branched-subunit amino acid transport system permease subunit
VVYVAGVASPLAGLLAGALAAGGLLTVALEQLSPGSTEAQLALNGILLVVVAIRFPSGILGARRARPDTADSPEDMTSSYPIGEA